MLEGGTKEKPEKEKKTRGGGWKSEGTIIRNQKLDQGERVGTAYGLELKETETSFKPSICS